MDDWQDIWHNTTMDQTRIGFLGRKLERIERKLDILLKQLNIEIPDEPVSPDMHNVKVLIDQGNIIEAIKVYRQQLRSQHRRDFRS
jgi:hypothetical protein